MTDGFFIWDRPGHPTYGWAFRNGAQTVGGPVDDDPCETEQQKQERWDAGTALSLWMGGRLPAHWRHASVDEVGELMTHREVRRAMDLIL